MEEIKMYYRQPRYFADFRCVGGTCPNSCCIGWSILWTKEEIDKVKDDPNCSDELRALMESSFHQSSEKEVEGKFIVTLEGLSGRCPFLTEDNFCRIQRELGAEYLSNTCTVYPRGYIVADEICYRFNNMSCPSIMSKLLNDEKSADLVNFPVKKEVTYKNATINTPAALEKNPELKYRGELLEFFYELISDKKNSVETNIVLGALAAEQFSKLVEKKEYDRIPEAIKQIKPQLHDGAQIKKIEAIKPNYALKLATASKYFKEITHIKLLESITDKTDTLNIDLYNMGERRLYETYKDKPFFLRNIALNLLLELATPFKFTDHSIYENYAIFVLTFALLKLTAVASAELCALADHQGLINRGTDDLLTKAAAVVIRNIAHNRTKAGNLVKYMKQDNMFSPAYLALFIK